jgi:hypothetical protein
VHYKIIDIIGEITMYNNLARMKKEGRGQQGHVLRICEELKTLRRWTGRAVRILRGMG